MIGMLDKRVTFKRSVKTSDGRGGWTETWAEIDTVWAAVLPLRGSELIRYRSLNSRVTTKIVLRYRNDIDHTCRAYAGSREYRIEAVIPPAQSREYMEIMAFEDS